MLTALPYCHARSLFAAMQGELAGGCLLVGAVAVALLLGLTWQVYPQIQAQRWAAWVLPVLFGAWLLENTLLIWFLAGTLLPKSYLLAVYLPATLWLAWLSWMCYRPWPWKLRLGLLAVLLADLALFPLVFRVESVSAENKINFVWRS
jgi:hypothetical protein